MPQLLVALLLFAAVAGCRSAPPVAPVGLDTLDGLIWLQRAEEARQLQRSVFLAASRALESGLADPSWRALDQPPEAFELPPAVIVDIDETMLDNMAFQVEQLRLRLPYDEQRWREWVLREEARAVPGALDFARLAEALGVTVFYVSNRDAESEGPTRANLEALGFPLAGDGDVVLLRGERPEWSSDKQGRRDLVASGHRVLVLIGDDLNDFVTVRGSTLEERDALAAEQAERFGSQWFVLPNPVYGSWLRAFLAEAGGSSGDLDALLERLDGYE